MIPGPPPGLKMSAETSHFVQQHAGHGTTILTICTGCFVAAQAGILDGLNASGPRALVPSLRKGYPKVVWDDKHRWVKSVSNHGKGEIWSSGDGTNVLEMVAAFLKEKLPGPLSETFRAMAGVGDKGDKYGATSSVETAWWLGHILRALFLGRRK